MNVFFIFKSLQVYGFCALHITQSFRGCFTTFASLPKNLTTYFAHYLCVVINGWHGWLTSHYCWLFHHFIRISWSDIFYWSLLNFANHIPYTTNDFSYTQVILIIFALHDIQLFIVTCFMNSHFGYWVKPRPSTWFSWVFMTEYDDERWVENFKMSNILLFKIVVKMKVLIN